MNTIDYQSYPLKVRNSFSFDRKALVDGILKYSCAKKRWSTTGTVNLHFQDSTVEYDEAVLRQVLDRLSRPTLTAVVAAFMRATDELTHGFLVRAVRCYVESSPQSKAPAEAVLYYSSRLSNVLMTFSAPHPGLYAKCISIAADVASSARLFRNVDDRDFRSGSFYADRSMKGIAAWFCLGREKLVDAETLQFLSKNLELLAPHADEIRKLKFYNVEVLQHYIDLTIALNAAEMELQVAASK